MFTGIIKEVGRVASVKSGGLVVSAAEVVKGMQTGDSVAVNGVCLTVTSFDAGSFSVDVMQETLRRSNLGSLSAGKRVNLEMPLTLNTYVGGHLVQGHIDDTGKLTSIRQERDSRKFRFSAAPELMRYVVEKGFIAVDGISLTVVSRTSDSFDVSIVTHTYENTNLRDRRVGDEVNLEIDIIAKYVEQLAGGQGKGITAEFLREHGYALS